MKNLFKTLLVIVIVPLVGLGQNVFIPDANFKAILLANTAINTNGDNEIQLTEAATYNGSLNVSFDSIADLTGIESFSAIEGLNCTGNQLTSLDVSQNVNLRYLDCEQNQLISLDVCQNVNLESLDCQYNELASLDVCQNVNLRYLNCASNQLTNLDVSQNINLESLNCPSNQLTSLDVNQNTKLNFLQCTNNQLTSLDVSQNTELYQVLCRYNQLTSLDFSQNDTLTYLMCGFNPLTYLNIQNGYNMFLRGDECEPGSSFLVFDCYGVKLIPTLSCIQVDDATWAYSSWLWTSSIDTSFQYFSEDCSITGIQERTENKKLLKVIDLLGRESSQINQLLIYIYDDGSVEKKIVID